jgi:geranylgeranyl pyrophosphate synthase
LADVIVELSKQGNLPLLSEMAEVIKDLAEGEWLQVDAQTSRNLSRGILNDIALKKTAKVMAYCTTAPAILAGKSPDLVEECRNFGTYLGLAFQLRDDSLDMSTGSQKDLQLDLKNNQVNSLIYEWFRLNPSLYERYQSGESLENLFDGSGIQDAKKTVDEMTFENLNLARGCLLRIGEMIPKKNALVPLEKILYYLSQREF